MRWRVRRLNQIYACVPTAQIAVMGPEAAVNAVYANKIAALEGQEKIDFVRQKREEYQQDIDIYRLASEMIIDGIVQPDDLRSELITRYAVYTGKKMTFSERKHPVYPV